MNNTWEKAATAFWIEYHWWKIRRLQKQQQRSKTTEHHIALHRYKAAQLADLYEVLSGIRDTAGRVIG
jgi:hypothetical protein